MNRDMLIKDPSMVRDLQNGILTVDELTRHLLKNYSAYQLAEELSKILISKSDEPSKPIVMSVDDFQAHFRLKGYRFQDGQLVKENRGKVKEK